MIIGLELVTCVRKFTAFLLPSAQ